MDKGCGVLGRVKPFKRVKWVSWRQNRKEDAKNTY